MSGEGSPPPGDAGASPATSSEVARRILTRDVLAPGQGTESATPEAAILELQRSCMRVTDALRSSVGDAGCAALLSRAFALTERTHPVLRELRRCADEDIRLDRIAASAGAHGVDDVTAAVVALIAAVIDILTRLVGDDMAIRLLDQDGPQSPTHGGIR